MSFSAQPDSRTGLRLAVVTDTEHPGLRPDEIHLGAALRARGVTYETVPWGAPVSATSFDAALVRTPWDYFKAPKRFLSWVEGLDVPVLNSPATLRWNHAKGYLLELRDAGVARLPATVWIPEEERSHVRPNDLLEALQTDRMVVKPAVSGGAWHTRLVSRGQSIEWASDEAGDYLAQAYVPAIAELGECSLMYFGGEFSHAVRKTPAQGDFRVQDDFGGGVRAEAPSPELLSVSEEVLAGAARCIGGDMPTYARVDLVEDPGGPLLMELELIEPELFFRADEASASRLVDAVLRTTAPA